MADYTGNSSTFRSYSLSFIENTDPSWELINPFMSMNPSLLQNQSLDCQNLMGLYSDPFLTHQASQIHAQIPHNPQAAVPCGDEYGGRNKRKAEEMTENSSFNSSSLTSVDVGSIKKPCTEAVTRKNSSSRGKRAKHNGKKAGDKPEEVVHVRARRGQATDSHSIAERVRRGKINERLRCLQDIVPGCYKTMGMAVMLDEIINYVQSLQNQVEFLSMKLTAASQFYDFNAETEETIDNIQKMKAQSSHEAQDLQRMICNEGKNDQILANFFQPTWPF